MGAAKTDDLFPDLRNPEGTYLINERCLIRTQDEHRVVLVSGIVLAQYALTDQMAEAYAMVNLVEQGWATQQDVAHAFQCSARTVRRDQRRFEDGGLAALGHLDGYPKGQPRLATARREWINRLKAQGHSHREIARRAGVSEMAMRTQTCPLFPLSALRRYDPPRRRVRTQTCPLFPPLPKKVPWPAATPIRVIGALTDCWRV